MRVFLFFFILPHVTVAFRIGVVATFVALSEKVKL